MSNAKLIENARKQLKAGNIEAYKRMMSGLLRSSMSSRTTNAITKALQEDGITL